MGCSLCDSDEEFGTVVDLSSGDATDEALCQRHFTQLRQRASRNRGCLDCGSKPEMGIRRIPQGTGDERRQNVPVWCRDHYRVQFEGA
ncbi:MAG: hypothetical protein ABEI96_09470 [Haloarculaceae archaeon]